MTKEETREFLHILNINFPNAFQHLKTQKDIQGIEHMWSTGFKNQTLAQMLQALTDYLSTGIDISTPSLGKLFGDMKKMIVSNIDIPQLDVESCWEKVLILAKCDYNQSKQNFYTLPINVQKALGSPQVLVDIAYSNPNRNDYLRNDFIKKLRNILAEEVTEYKAGKSDLKAIAYNNGTIDGTIEGLPNWYADKKQTEPTKELLLEIEKMKKEMGI